MRGNTLFNAKRRKFAGLSLVELAMVIMVVSLALVPIIKMMGGPNSDSGNGKIEQVTGLKSKEILLANTLLEHALSSDFRVFNCGQNFDPLTGLPTTGQSLDLPASQRCVSNTYNQPLYYQWTVKNMDANGADMPTGNHYYTAVLNVWNTASGGTPLLTLPTSLFWNESGALSSVNTTGIVVVLDTSGSMSWGAVDNTPPTSVGPDWLASPYLKYRYTDPAIGYNPVAAGISAGMVLNLNDNAQLDITSGWDADDPNTAWDDRYLHPGILGVHRMFDGTNRPKDCSNEPSGINSPWWDELWEIPNNRARTHVNALCSASGGPNGAAWQATMDRNMSRIEAARSSLLSFLLSIEEDPELYENTKLGFTTFSTDVTDRVVNPIESVDANNRYPRMRRAFSWINRHGPGIIPSRGSTNMYAALERGADLVFSEPNLDNRVILFVGDGEPTIAPTDHASFRTLATRIGDGTYPGANGEKAAVFTLGLLSNDADLPRYLRDDIAVRTPGGQYFFANSIGDVGPIFDQVKYQIQRMILLNKSNRFNVNFS